MTTPRLIVRPDPTDKIPGLYFAYIEGTEINSRSNKPFFDGARRLQGLGFSGPFEMWYEGASFPTMRGTIERCAPWRLSERDDRGFKTERYSEPPSRRRGK